MAKESNNNIESFPEQHNNNNNVSVKLETDQTRDLLQFAIIGFDRCGTTSLMRDVFGEADRIFIPTRDIQLLQRNELAAFTALYQDKRNRQTKISGAPIINGVQSSGLLRSKRALQAMSTYFPDIKFIISMKHPVLWFSSWYNFRRTIGFWGDDPPSPQQTLGFCEEVCLGETATSEGPKNCVGKDYVEKFGHTTCAGLVNFHVYLSRLGFTTESTTSTANDSSTTTGSSMLEEEMELLGGFQPTQFPFPNAKLFLMEVSQFDDDHNNNNNNKNNADNSMAKAVLQEMEDFLQLGRGSLGDNVPGVEEQSGESDVLDICAAEHAPIRDYLLEIGGRSSKWIENYLLKSPQVTAAVTTEFLNRIRQWNVDPCVTREKERQQSPPIIDKDNKHNNAKTIDSNNNIKNIENVEGGVGLNACPHFCGASNCNLPACVMCEFTCGGTCQYEQDRLQKFNKQQEQERRGKNHPQVDMPITKKESSTSFSSFTSTFQDITDFVLQQDESFQRFPGIARPTFPENAPLFVDLNNDGILDFFQGSHHKTLAESRIVPALSLSKDGGTANTSSSTTRIELRDVSGQRILSEIDQGDVHGNLIVDLDGDGILDLIRAVGGGQGGLEFDSGAVSLSNADNRLFWGELRQQQQEEEEGTSGGTDKKKKNFLRASDKDTTTKPTFFTYFNGGIESAVKAGVGGTSFHRARGRMFYILDVNGDGLLDLYFSADRPRTDHILAGRLLINQGDRTWKEDEGSSPSSSIREYSTTMLLTDVDGDGFANEFVITRDHCFPQHPPPYPSEVMSFCSTRPVGTTAVFKYNKVKERMIDIGKRYTNVTSEYQPACCQPGWGDTFDPNNRDCFVRSSASADFDGDQLADQVFLYGTKVMFYFSSDRPVGTLPFGDQWVDSSNTIYFPLDCHAKTLRVLDFDNDGKEEILVGCHEPGRFLMYTQHQRESHNNQKPDWVLQNTNNHDDNSSSRTAHGGPRGPLLGDLTNLELIQPNAKDAKRACETNFNDLTNDICKIRTGEVVDPAAAVKILLAGVSSVDFNNDGFLDLVVAYQRGHLMFLQNTPNSNMERHRYLVVKLIGKAHGLGASVILYSEQCHGCETQFREVSSYQHETDKWGFKDDRIQFGLGPVGRPKKIVVRWANGDIQTHDLSSWEFTPDQYAPVSIVQQEGVVGVGHTTTASRSQGSAAAGHTDRSSVVLTTHDHDTTTSAVALNLPQEEQASSPTTTMFFSWYYVAAIIFAVLYLITRTFFGCSFQNIRRRRRRQHVCRINKWYGGKECTKGIKGGQEASSSSSTQEQGVVVSSNHSKLSTPPQGISRASSLTRRQKGAASNKFLSEYD